MVKNLANRREPVKRFQGVYSRKGLHRPPVHGRPDTCFDITYKDIKSKKIWEKIGWSSEGITAAYAAQVRAERIRKIRLGDEVVPLQQRKALALTLSELAEKYFEWAERNTRGHLSEKSRFDNHIAPTLGEKALHDITSFELERLKMHLQQKQLRPKSVHHVLTLIRSMYSKAAAWGLYDGSVPTRDVNFPKVNNRRLRFLTQREAMALLQALLDRSKQVHNQALLSLHCGLRFGEIASLTWQDLDFSSKVIHIRHPKSGESRSAFMTRQVSEMLVDRRKNWEMKNEEALKKDPDATVSPLVFPDLTGKVQTGVSRLFDRVVEELGLNSGITDPLQKVVFHSLRHTFASWLAIQGTPLYTIKELMGHKNITMTERYSHLIPDHKRMAVQRLANSLSAVQRTRQPAKTKE